MNEHAVADFTRRTGELLAGHLNDLGLLVYSSVDTLKESPVVFWGYNPGGGDEVTDPTLWTIAEALERFPSQDYSFITGQQWPNGSLGTVPDGKGGKRYWVNYEVGQAPYQRAVAAVLNRVGYPQALVTNFIFFQSQRQDDLQDTDRKIDLCWPVHQLLFQIARPRVLITTKTVTDHLQRRGLMQFGRIAGSIASGWSNWKCSHWREVKVPSCPTLGDLTVLTIAHPSFWGKVIDRKGGDALRWLSEKVGEALKPTGP
jgi:hypothetical protein